MLEAQQWISQDCNRHDRMKLVQSLGCAIVPECLLNTMTRMMTRRGGAVACWAVFAAAADEQHWIKWHLYCHSYL